MSGTLGRPERERGGSQFADSNAIRCRHATLTLGVRSQPGIGTASRRGTRLSSTILMVTGSLW